VILRRTRRDAIRELLAADPVRSQKDLRAALLKLGFRTSQPVLSRDLRALGVAKSGGQYQFVAEERVTPLGALRPLLRGVGEASFLVIVRCEPGSASAVARALDAEAIPGVVGSVAGDDTIFIATASRAAGRRVREHIADEGRVPLPGTARNK
jgi:transcriptional regulator of arginine metabolism